MNESIQKKLGRVRPPRVQITYDVETGNAIEMKELPFLVGILADLSGKRAEPLPKLKDRKFVEIDRDNFDDVLASSKPRLAYQAENTLQKDGSKLNILLEFNSMDDFEPVNIIHQVKPLSALYEARRRLSDLLTKLDGNDELDNLLKNVIDNTETQQKLKTELGGEPATDEPVGSLPEPA